MWRTREIQECRQITDAVTVQYDVSKVERPWSTCIIMRRIPGRVGVIAIIMIEQIARLYSGIIMSGIWDEYNCIMRVCRTKDGVIFFSAKPDVDVVR